ncbi:MAG: hypothetical protein JKY67_10270 [Pseudomonadales bacterium]|nr:hypothetical protein [Pseudomonadales bacterium]
MEALKVKELRLMLKGGAVASDLVIVPVVVEGKSKLWFELNFSLKGLGEKEEVVLITSLNERQQWGSVNNLYQFIDENFPDINTVELKIDRGLKPG